ncbi:kinase-like domain-containing protein [Aspergillus ambiguus]|uniref:kinase-like domain-containing protein n=1 Tax=Aspergillus ambiguus TaxID=176160 RepID=UPI003CCD1593
MAPRRKLDSPIELPYHTPLSCGIKEERGITAYQDSGYVRYQHPYSVIDRFFVGIEPRWGGIDAIEFTQDRPVSYVKSLGVAEGEVRVRHLKPTSHPNLVNLRETFVVDNTAFFVYEPWGISLREFRQLQPIFRLGEVEVATICGQVLNGLEYIHDKLGMVHGKIQEGNIYIMENGDVKIANIGERMIQQDKGDAKGRDIGALGDLVKTVLGLQSDDGTRGTTGLLARDFAGAACSATIEELLHHPFLNLQSGGWCLRPMAVLCAIAQKWRQSK